MWKWLQQMVEKSGQHRQFSTVGGTKLLYYNTFLQQKGKRASRWFKDVDEATYTYHAPKIVLEEPFDC